MSVVLLRSVAVAVVVPVVVGILPFLLGHIVSVFLHLICLVLLVVVVIVCSSCPCLAVCGLVQCILSLRRFHRIVYVLVSSF